MQAAPFQCSVSAQFISGLTVDRILCCSGRPPSARRQTLTLIAHCRPLPSSAPTALVRRPHCPIPPPSLPSSAAHTVLFRRPYCPRPPPSLPYSAALTASSAAPTALFRRPHCPRPPPPLPYSAAPNALFRRPHCSIPPPPLPYYAALIALVRRPHCPRPPTGPRADGGVGRRYSIFSVECASCELCVTLSHTGIEAHRETRGSDKEFGLTRTTHFAFTYFASYYCLRGVCILQLWILTAN